MTLDRRHLFGALALLAAAIAYNVSMMSDRSAPARAVAPPPLVSDAPPRQVENAPIPSTDSTPVGPPAEVALDRLPVWPRDPFVDPAYVEPPPPVIPAPPPPAPEPDPIVGSILFSEGRRLAIVDGRIVHVGDVIGTSRVVDIEPRAIVIESAVHGRRVVGLRTKGERP